MVNRAVTTTRVPTRNKIPTCFRRFPPTIIPNAIKDTKRLRTGPREPVDKAAITKTSMENPNKNFLFSLNVIIIPVSTAHTDMKRAV